MTLDELVVKLILDAKDFAKGQKDATDALAKTKESAVVSSKAIEASALSASQGVEKLGRQFLGLFALLTGAQGIKAFLSDLTTTDAALGRTAKNLDMSGRSLSTWQGVAEVAGGTAQGITGSMAGLSNAMQMAALTGDNKLAPVFRALGINLATTGGKARDMTAIMFDLNKSAQGMDPARFAAMMHMAGVDDGTISLLEKATTEFGKLYAEQQKYAANSEDIEAAQQRQTGWRELTLTTISLGRSIATALTPAMVGAMKAVQDWADKNQEWIRTGIVEKVGQFVEYLRNGVDWSSIGKQAGEFARDVRDIVVALGEAVRGVDGNSPIFKAFEAFGALLIGSRVLGAINQVAGAITAFGTLPIPPVLARLLGLAATPEVGLAAVTAAAGVATAQAAKRTAQDMSDGSLADPSVGIDPETGLTFHVAKPKPEQPERPEAAPQGGEGGGGLWGWIKKLYGFGGADAADPRTREAILNTEKATGELRDIAKRQAGGAADLGADAAGGAGGGIMGAVGRAFRNAGAAAGAGFDSGTSRPAKGALAANQKIAYEAALKEGLSPKAARAQVANMSGEGLAVPNDYHWDGKHYSGGIVQWDPERAAAIKAKFGDVPWKLSVADQTRASIWEWRTNPRFAATKRAMEGDDSGEMIRALVTNYEDPANKGKAIAQRMGYYRGFNPGEAAPAAAAAPTPAGTSAKAVTDAEVFAARQRLAAGGRDPKDIALRDRYMKEQSAPKAPLPMTETKGADGEAFTTVDRRDPRFAPHPVTYNDVGRHLMNVLSHARRLTHHDGDKPVRVLPVGRDGSPAHAHAAAISDLVRMASAGRYVSHTSNSSHTEHHMHGDITVQTQATDAKGIAGSLDKYLFQGSDARQANRGLA